MALDGYYGISTIVATNCRLEQTVAGVSVCMWWHHVHFECVSSCLLIAGSVLIVTIVSNVKVLLKETPVYVERNMESATLFTVDTSSSVLDMVINATEKAATLLPAAQNLIFDTVLTNYTQSMCDELASLDIIRQNGNGPT